MNDNATILPPVSTPLERALEAATARIADVPIDIRDLWNPATCPAHLLPWLAWGLSIDLWNANWSEATKRAAIAGAIEEQRRKGTRATLRAVLDRFDQGIKIVEWFEDRENLPVHAFRLELPLASESEVEYNEQVLLALLRDITAIKPLRSQLIAVHTLRAQAALALSGGASAALAIRRSIDADSATALEPAWATYLQDQDGQPLQDQDGNFLEAA